MAEVKECLGSQVEEARLDTWTSVGHVKVQGQSGRHGAFTIMHMCTWSGLTSKYDFVRYLARIAVSRDSKSVVRNTNSLRPL